MKISLFLSNKKGHQSLLKILDNVVFTEIIEQVIISKDSGNAEDYYEEIKFLCIQNNIRVFDRKESYKIKADFSIAIGWRWLIFGVKNLIVIHDSLLPKYRGFSPLPNMLINGENYLGVTAIYASEEMDEGDIIYQEKVKINYPLKISEAINIVSNLYEKIIYKIFFEIKNGNNINRIPQDISQATYSIWRDNEDYRIDWSKDANYIKRFVDAVGYPFDGAQTKLNSVIIRVLEVSVVENMKFELVHIGKILTIKDNCPIIVCGKNAIKIIKAENLDGNPVKFSKLRTRLI